MILEAVLRKDGSVGEVKVLRGLGKGKYGMEQSAVDAVRKWEFEPGQLDGRPSDVRMTMKIDFILEDEGKALPVSAWSVAGNRENCKPPKAILKHKPRGMGDDSPSAILPVVVRVDAEGSLLTYNVAPEIMEKMAFPEVILENLETILAALAFKPAKLDETGLETKMSIKLTVPLEPMGPIN